LVLSSYDYKLFLGLVVAWIAAAKVLSHETVGVELPAGFLAGFSQRFEEIMPVNVVEKDFLATIPAAHQVVNRTRKLNSKLAGHWSSLKLGAHLRKEESTAYRLTPFLFSFLSRVTRRFMRITSAIEAMLNRSTQAFRYLDL
jgi:hypothetical protein